MNKEVMSWLAWGAGILVVALGARYFRELGYIDKETTTRVVIGLNGLMIAWMGNRIPKAIAPNATIQQIKRLAGWSLALSGLVYAGLWAFAPIPVAKVVGSAAVITGIAVTFGYCLFLRAKAKAAAAVADTAP
jgi:hypothetical protein